MEDVLPDVLVPGLAVVFCGNAASAASARRGAYYAGPGNSFWRTLSELRLTPVMLEPEEFRRLPEFGIGLTDVCKARSGSDTEVGSDAHDPDRLEREVARVAPAELAFVGKRAAEAALGKPVNYGSRPEPFAGARAWVLPSTSGAARGFWSIEPWRQLAAAASSRR